MAYSFHTGSKEIKLFEDYESASRKVLLPVESILQNAKQLEYLRARLSSGSKACIICTL